MSYYAERLHEFGPDIRALGWGSRDSQFLRFEVLSEIAELDGCSVLDYGCGFGDLSSYLYNVEYIGYDCDPEMLAIAQKKYPCTKFVDKPVAADYVLASGVFNLVKHCESDIREMWDLCRKGMAVNFTSSFAAQQTAGIVYRDPFESAWFFSALTKKLVLRTDYKSNDFAIYAYRP